jgi:hypothetical protein
MRGYLQPSAHDGGSVQRLADGGQASHAARRLQGGRPGEDRGEHNAQP